MRYNDDMNANEMIRTARALRTINQSNKWGIARKRARSARITATRMNLPQPTKFNEPYKYG